MTTNEFSLAHARAYETKLSSSNCKANIAGRGNRCCKIQCKVYIEPEVLQSGFGVFFLFWPGEFWENCRQISQRILRAKFLREFLGLVFPGFQALSPPKIHAQYSRPKFTPKIVGIPLQFHFLERKNVSRRFSAYHGGDQYIVTEQLHI